VASAKVEAPQTSLYACLESFVREAFIQKRHVTAIFFDIEKSYDTTRKFGILKDLHDACLRSRLPLFIAGFLHDRKFQVRLGGSYSKLSEQETGVPHGKHIICYSVLSEN